MASNLQFTRLGGDNASFQQMIKRFGVVTVMNARIYEPLKLTREESGDAGNVFDELSASKILLKYCTVSGDAGSEKIEWNGYDAATNPLLARIDTLKVANANQEGPSKTVTGGQYANPLIKFGKTMTLEMQDALGDARVLDALNGTVSETKTKVGASGTPGASGYVAGRPNYDEVYALHVTSDFQGPKLIVGDTFFIDQKSGQQIKALIAFYQFLPDSIFNLTQDAEGDATVFDMNGSLLATDIIVKNIDGKDTVHGVFYSVVDPAEVIAASKE